MNPKVSLFLLIMLVGFPQISETIYTPALPNITKALHTSASLAEITLTLYFLGFAVGVFLWGAFSDYYGRRSAMLIGLSCYILTSYLCAQSQTIEALFIWRFFQAFGASVGSVITQIMIRDLYVGTKRAKIFSIIAGSLAFSPALGPVIGGFMSGYFDWRANFWVLIIMGLLLALFSFFSLPETAPKKITPPSLKSTAFLFCKMMKSTLLWGHILLISATNGILFGFYQEAPFIFTEKLHMQVNHYGFFGLLIATATLLAARFSFSYAAQWGPYRLIKSGAAITFIGGVFYTFLVFLDLFDLSFFSMILITIALFLIFFGIGMIIPNSLSQALLAYQDQVGSASSIFGGSYYLFIALFTWLMSVFHNGSAFPLPLFITALGIILILASQIVFYFSLQNKQPLTTTTD